MMLVDISGTKELNLKYKIQEFETNSKINLCRGINGFKKGYWRTTNSATNRLKGDVSDLIPYPTAFWLGGEIISASHSMNTCLVKLGIEKYPHLNQQYLCQVPLSLSSLL